MNGTVPSSELGVRVASAATCLTGNSTWGSCGGGAPAGITYATTALNWTQTISSSLTGGTQATVTLTPCPLASIQRAERGIRYYSPAEGRAKRSMSRPRRVTALQVRLQEQFTSRHSIAIHRATPSVRLHPGCRKRLTLPVAPSRTYRKNGQCNVTLSRRAVLADLHQSMRTTSTAPSFGTPTSQC